MPVWEIETPDGGLIQVEGDEEPTEDQIASFFTPEEPIQQPTIPRLQSGATLADVLRQPPLVTPPWEGGVVRSVLPGVLQPEDLLPAVRKIGGAIAEGEPGDTHPDIITREQIPAIEIDQRGFTGPEGQFLDREAAAQATGIPTMREPGRLHSTDLSAFQEPGGFEAQLEAAKDVPEPLIKLPEVPESIKEAYSAPVRAIFGDKAADVEVAAADALYKAAKSVPEFLTTEEGMLSLLASLIPAGRAGVTAFFTADQAKSVLDQAKEIGGKWDEMTAPQKAAAVTQAAASLGFTALMAKAGVGEIGRMVKPEVPAPPVIPEEAKPARSLTPAIRLPDGQIFTGPAHKDIFIKVARETGEPDLLAEASKPQNQGFVNEKGEFKSRSEASPIFKELTGKEPADVGSLKSEDFVGFEHLFDFGEKAAPKVAETLPPAKEAKPSIGAGIRTTAIEEPTTTSVNPIDIKIGDNIRWEPSEYESRYQVPVEGIVQDVIHNTEGDIGYHIFSPTEYDPSNVVRVWANRGKVVSRTTNPLEVSGEGKVLGSKTTDAGRPTGLPAGKGRTPTRPKSIVAIADEIAAKGIDPQASYGQFVKARDLKPEISASEWLPIYRRSLELAKLNREIEISKRGGSSPSKTIGAGIQAALMRKAEAGAVQIPQGVTDAVTKAADYVKEARAINKMPKRPWIGPLYYGDVYGKSGGHPKPSKYGDYGSGHYVTPSLSFADQFAKGTAFNVPIKGSGKVFQVEVDPPTKPFMADASLLTPQEISHWENDGFDMTDVRTHWDLIEQEGGRNVVAEDLRGQSEAWDDFLNKFGYDAVFDGKQLMLKRGNVRPIDSAKTGLSEPTKPSIGTGIQAALMRKAESGAVQIPQGVTDAVAKAADYVKEVASEEMNAPKMTDTRRSVLNWSAKLQKSFNESSLKQRDITRRVPKPIRREGITNWIQANGDPEVLRQRAAATTDPKLKRGYEAALNLTPDEIAVANEVKQAYADFASRGQAADVLGQLKENYVTQTWNLGKGPSGGAVGRTLKEKFRYSKASTFANFFEGEQAGYKPKTKDIAKLLPMYSHEMNSVIAAREMVAQMAEGKASDGRPLLAPKGIGVPVDSGEGGKATLVMPKVGKEATADYKVLPNQPALSGWKWVSKDEAGNPIFLKADLALHPEAFDKLKNVLGRSAIRDWYGTRTTALAEIPKMLVKGIDMANSETKRTMLGLLATFHQIQTGTHAIGHRVNPLFSIPKIDLVNNPLQMDAAKHGLMMAPDRASMSQFMEGFRTSGLVSKIPIIGPAADWYSHYLFHDYIPGLKFKTYDAILRRNEGVYAKDLKSGKVSPEDVKILSAEQANAAYGHINYADLGRNPTVQHFAQLGLLAPDFLEARARFAGQAIKGIAGAKVGREQLLALGTLAIAQATGAYVISKMVDGEWDSKRPFEFTKGNRRYTLRSVPEDMQNLVTKTRQFVHNRISPLVGKGLLQYLTGIDYRGQRVKASETTKELLAQPLPLTIRGFTGLSKSTLSSMEQLAGSLGLRISRYSPQMDLADIVRDYKKGSDDPKLQAQIELQEKEVFASVYDKLRTALHSNDLEQAKKEYDKLKAIRTPKQIDNAMKPWTGGTVNRETLAVSPRKPKPFTGSLATEKKFIQSLTQDQRDVYNRAQEERIKFYRTFRDMLRQTGQ